MRENENELLVINPNSSDFVTKAIQDTVMPFQGTAKCRIDCIGLSDAPKGIDTQEDVKAVIPLIAACVEERHYDGYVLACFSDPGIRELRRRSPAPVFGIGECAYLQAMSLGERFGVISTVAEAVDRHHRYLTELGFERRLAADLPLDLRASELAHGMRAHERVLEVAEALVKRDANVLILGCAGMSQHRRALVKAFGVPVIEPTLAAVQFALNSFSLD